MMYRYLFWGISASNEDVFVTGEQYVRKLYSGGSSATERLDQVGYFHGIK